MHILSKNVADQEAYMNHIINKRFFCNFLQREGALKLWKKVNKRNNSIFLCTSVDMWILLSNWELSSNRTFVWTTLHHKWNNYLKQINQLNHEGINSFD